MYERTLTAMNDVLIPRVEVAERLITGSWGIGINAIFQSFDRRKFTVNTEITTFRSASSQLDFDLNIQQGEIDETIDIGNSEVGDFLATILKYVRIAHAHQMVTGHNTPHCKVPSISWVEIKLKKTHCHKNALNPNTLLLIEHTPPRQNSDSGNASTDLLKQLQVLRLNNDPKRGQQYSNQPRRTH